LLFGIKELVAGEEFDDVIGVQPILVFEQEMDTAEEAQAFEAKIFALAAESALQALPREAEQFRHAVSGVLQKGIDGVALSFQKFIPLLQIEPHVWRDEASQLGGVQIGPVVQDGGAEADVGVVALGVHLFAEEVDEAVATLAQFIQFGAQIADLSFGADLAVKDGKLPQKVLELNEDGPDIGIEESGDVLLKEVFVRDKDAIAGHIDHEVGQQVLAEYGVDRDQLHAEPDVFDVVLVDIELPVFPDADFSGTGEGQQIELLDKVGHVSGIAC